jgi:hypothetical protein
VKPAVEEESMGGGLLEDLIHTHPGVPLDLFQGMGPPSNQVMSETTAPTSRGLSQVPPLWIFPTRGLHSLPSRESGENKGRKTTETVHFLTPNNKRFTNMVR